jgi:hypothetical protein
MKALESITGSPVLRSARPSIKLSKRSSTSQHVTRFELCGHDHEVKLLCETDGLRSIYAVDNPTMVGHCCLCVLCVLVTTGEPVTLSTKWCVSRSYNIILCNLDKHFTSGELGKASDCNATCAAGYCRLSGCSV